MKNEELPVRKPGSVKDLIQKFSNPENFQKPVQKIHLEINPLDSELRNINIHSQPSVVAKSSTNEITQKITEAPPPRVSEQTKMSEKNETVVSQPQAQSRPQVPVGATKKIEPPKIIKQEVKVTPQPKPQPQLQPQPETQPPPPPLPRRPLNYEYRLQQQQAQAKTNVKLSEKNVFNEQQQQAAKKEKAEKKYADLSEAISSYFGSAPTRPGKK